MPNSPKRILVSWSSGKDSAWMLHLLQRQADIAIAALVTTYIEDSRRVSAHGVDLALVERQAACLGLPLIAVPLPPRPCPNSVYRERLNAVYREAKDGGVSAVAFGDLFLEDIRAFRTEHMQEVGLEPLFPLFAGPQNTAALAQNMLDAGFRVKIVCVDPKRLDASFAGRDWNRALLDALPEGIDPCGENGEFHTFCYGGPVFKESLALDAGAVEEREGFCFAAFHPA